MISFPQASIRVAAQATLQRSYQPPARYGTAFHITPPMTDLRDFLPPVGPTTHHLAGWTELSPADQAWIITTCARSADPYLAWHLANWSATSTQLLHIPAGHTQQIEWDERCASSLYFIIVEPEAELTLQESLANLPFAVRRVFIWQKAASHVRVTSVRTHTAFLNEQVIATLAGRGAEIEATHLTLGQTNNQADITVHVHHASPQTVSQLQIRSAAHGRSRTIYRSRIVIPRASTGSQAQEKAQGLLLSPSATLDLLPELDIATDNVRASHGVTTSHLDDAKLFYLRTRGLSHAEARHLALTGFFHHQLTIPHQLATTLAAAIRSEQL